MRDAARPVNKITPENGKALSGLDRAFVCYTLFPLICKRCKQEKSPRFPGGFSPITNEEKNKFGGLPCLHCTICALRCQAVFPLFSAKNQGNKDQKPLHKKKHTPQTRMNA